MISSKLKRKCKAPYPGLHDVTPAHLPDSICSHSPPHLPRSNNSVSLQFLEHCCTLFPLSGLCPCHSVSPEDSPLLFAWPVPSFSSLSFPGQKVFPQGNLHRPTLTAILPPSPCFLHRLHITCEGVFLCVFTHFMSLLQVCEFMRAGFLPAALTEW